MRRLLRGLGPNVIALGFASFFTDFAAEMIVPLLAVFVVDSLKASKAALGAIEGISESAASILRVVSGWMSDRFRVRKPFILVGYGITSIARPIFGLAMAAWHVGAVRLLDRIGKGVRLSARDALIADSSEPWARGKAFGLQRALDHFGAMVAPLVAFMLLQGGWDVREVFLLTAIPAALVLVVIAGFVRDVPVQGPPAPRTRLSLAPFDGNFRWFLLTVTVFTLANSSDQFILLRARDAGLEAVHLPLVWSGLCLIRMLASLPAGIWSDRVDRRWVVLAGWIIYAVVYAGLAFARTPAAYLALVGIYGLHHALSESVLRAVVADLVPASVRGIAYGLFHFCVGIAILPASLGFGLIATRWGSGPAFLVGAALASLACVMLLRVRMRAAVA